ncbi:hypothetical protein M434DRAFT_35237 [Hypoxylon sp. CO27-5]|nr:hypothetical protein M434DRAFT_35237 [Hypoxylon sp. CO27-5]
MADTRSSTSIIQIARKERHSPRRNCSINLMSAAAGMLPVFSNYARTATSGETTKLHLSVLAITVFAFVYGSRINVTPIPVTYLLATQSIATQLNAPFSEEGN